MEDKKPIISHLYCKDGTWHIQSNEAHCAGTARYASEFASEFGMREWGELIGLMHDRGKEKQGFQSYIKKESGYDESCKSNDNKNHSYVGAVLVHAKCKHYDVLHWLSNPIAGHHRGLYDTDELDKILLEDVPEEVNKAVPEFRLGMPETRPGIKDSSHLCRMLFSCLVDADRLDTERFMSVEKAQKRDSSVKFEDLKHSLERYLEQFKSDKLSEINKVRQEIQAECKKKSILSPGFFSLTVPTGGGKTISSMVWAINHALAYGKKRIIIAIPYTSIIVQTASVLREIFGDRNVLEHHSAVDEESVSTRATLAVENWDAPIIVTTNVQLLESMFSNRPSKCRKLHSVCNSVIIFDEVQTLPLAFMQPTIDCLKTYVKMFGVSILFCTASQPVFEENHNGLGKANYTGLSKGEIRSIIPSSFNLHNRLRRVLLSIQENPITVDSLVESLAKHDKVLCIVNSRALARDVYRRMESSGVRLYHLSRMMCPAHILETIDQIKYKLANTDEPIKVVSTQLIEAGVDIDFPVVFRQMAGLDSILQAAGRCNREGRFNISNTFVYQLEGYKAKGTIGFATNAMARMLALYPESDWFSPETMNRYFSMLYSTTPSFDSEGISEMTNDVVGFAYEECAKKFRLINEEGINVIVNFGDSEKKVEELKTFGPSRRLSRELGRYSVTIPRRLFDELKQGGLIYEPIEGFYYIPLKTQYDEFIGLNTENQYIETISII